MGVVYMCFMNKFNENEKTNVLLVYMINNSSCRMFSRLTLPTIHQRTDYRNQLLCDFFYLSSSTSPSYCQHIVPYTEY